MLGAEIIVLALIGMFLVHIVIPIAISYYYLHIREGVSLVTGEPLMHHAHTHMLHPA